MNTRVKEMEMTKIEVRKTEEFMEFLKTI